MNKEASGFQCVSTQHASYRYKHVTKSQVFSMIKTSIHSGSLFKQPIHQFDKAEGQTTCKDR